MSIRIIISMAFLALLAACAPVDVLNSFVSKEGYSVRQDIAYGKEDRQKLDIYLPEKRNRNTPVVVFFYGGSWQHGNKNDYLFVAQGLVSLGYIVVVPDYRLYPNVKYPAFLNDSAKAVVWVYQNISKLGGNSENLFLVGHSAGAYNAVMITVDRKYLENAGGNVGWIRGVVGMAGPYDFLPLSSEKIKAVFSSEKNLAKTQPINYVRARLPRMLLLTGTDDEVVGPKNSEHFYDKLKQYGNNVEIKEYDGVGHKGLAVGLATPIEWNSKVRDDIGEFINR